MTSSAAGTWRAVARTVIIAASAIAGGLMPAAPGHAQVRITSTPDAGKPAAAPVPTKPAEPALLARVQAYWAIRQKKDLSGMYDFYSTEYRGRVSRESFIEQLQRVSVDRKDPHITASRAAANRATVIITYGMRAPTPQEQWVETHTEEDWVKERDGVWRRVDEPMAAAFPTAVATPAFPGAVVSPGFPATVATPGGPDGGIGTTPPPATATPNPPTQPTRR